MKIVTENVDDESNIEIVIKKIGLKEASKISGRSIGFISDCMRGRRRMKYKDWKKFVDSKHW